MKGTKHHKMLTEDLTIRQREEALGPRDNEHLKQPARLVLSFSDDTFALLGEDFPHHGSHSRELQGLSAL